VLPKLQVNKQSGRRSVETLFVGGIEMRVIFNTVSVVIAILSFNATSAWADAYHLAALVRCLLVGAERAGGA
jgi:hypothetical protein